MVVFFLMELVNMAVVCMHMHVCVCVSLHVCACSCPCVGVFTTLE